MHKLHLPRLGQTMEAATIITWVKKEGESFNAGDVLYDMETEKAAQAVEAKLPGTMVRIVVPEGTRILVGTLLAIVADPGETLTEAQIAQAIAEEAAVDQTVQERTVAAGADMAASAPASHGSESAGRVRIMPLARRKAQELGVNLESIQGTGPRGTITVEDVEKAATASSGPRIKERRILRGVALSMADAVTRSWQIPQFVQIVLVDASGMAARRKSLGPEIKERYGIDLSYTDLILEAMVRAATEVPEANATFQSDNAIIMYGDVNVSLAVANQEGLVVVPVIHRAQIMSLGELAVKLRDVADRARAGTLTIDDIEGGTISLSNLGMYGVETGTPILTPPQSSLVFLGAMKDRPVVVAGEIVIRPTFYMSIVYDHRVLAGATAASFTGAVKRHMEAF